MNLLRRLLPGGRKGNQSEPLGFMVWLRQYGDDYGVSERSPGTFMWEGISFNVVSQPSGPDDLTVNLDSDEKRGQLQELLAHYRNYLKSNWPEKQVRDFVQFGDNSPVPDFGTTTA